MTKLVIVESPTKAKTIGRFLGKDFVVTSSYGHVRDLPKSKLGIDVEHDFLPQYIIPTKVKKRVTALKKEAAKSDSIILATDEDREGEAIAWHLLHALGLADGKIEKPVSRIVFHEITEKAIQAALEHPRSIDDRLVDAQQARRVLDRLVGYKLSPFLWKKIASGLSAGRVQSVALRLIVDREDEIRAFVHQEYWSVDAVFATNKNEEFGASLVKQDNAVLDKFAVPNQLSATTIQEDLQNKKGIVERIEKKELKKNPPTPFTTSTLQQEAAKRLRFSAKKTMLIAQRLYEQGFITYMRTDSLNLSSESTAGAKQWLSDRLGERYASDAPRTFKAKSKLAQEAHEAIRPTDPFREPEKTKLESPAEDKLYALIWSRFMGSQMPQAIVNSTTYDIAVLGDKHSYTFRAHGKQMIFDGFLKIWNQKFEEKDLPILNEQDNLTLANLMPEQHFTEPPARFSEATLVKALEEHGIGRPSTYAPTISVIQTRNYVQKDAGKFIPTEIGELVHKVMKEHFPEIVDLNFTANMENELDEIAEGGRKWNGVIKAFYEPFAKKLEQKYAEVEKQNAVPEKTDVMCEKCGKPMVIKMSRFGKFLACSGFPECRSTKKLEGSGAGKEPPKSTGLKCPKCTEGDVIERRVSRGRARGKIFWGCSRYPKCDYATWENPLGEQKETKGEDKEAQTEEPESEEDTEKESSI
ncbi:MAG: type I DNA topoisomerase [Patescibacteria group bacterium]